MIKHRSSLKKKYIQHPDGVSERNGSYRILCMEKKKKKKKEEKKQVGETESELEKKKAPHTTHKRMKIFFLKMIQADGHKNKIYLPTLA